MAVKACGTGTAVSGLLSGSLLDHLSQGKGCHVVGREEQRPLAHSPVNGPPWLGELLEHCGLANTAIANSSPEPRPL